MIKAIRIAETGHPGIAEITADGWDGRVLRMSYATCCKWIASSNASQPAGIYLLYADHFDRMTYGNQLYVGQSGTIRQRLDQHDGDKIFWTAAMVFSSAGDWMNIAYTVNVERQFIEWAKHANRYALDNKSDGRVEHLGNDDQERLRSFLDGVRPVLRLAGIDVFESNLDGVFSYEGFRGALSRLKIASGPPTPAVTIMAGSRFDRLNEEKVCEANLPGVSYDSAANIHTFNESVDVSLTGWELSLPMLFGSMLKSWKSTAGVSLHDSLKSLQRLG